MFKLHCEKEFEKMHKSDESMAKEVGNLNVAFADLNTYVRNGLSHRLGAVTALLGVVGAALVVAVVLNLIEMSG